MSNLKERWKQLCMLLLRAESEVKVEEIVKGAPEMQDGGAWKPLGEQKNNFGMVSNQASTGAKALTELITNMVDAVLLKAVRERGIDPKGPQAPRTMYEAVEKFFSADGRRILDGKLLSLEGKDKWLRRFARENLIVGVTGGGLRKGAGKPCFTFFDNGEGQHPDRFEKTFLSFGEEYKSEIPFVQGKYNMGSSGVLGYSGKHWYKLIISRRHDDLEGPWGWTLIRKRPADSESVPRAEYFYPREGIPAFMMDGVLPFQTQDGRDFDEVVCRSGSIVKLYDYRLGGSVDFHRTREMFNENLVETILPIRLMDFRQKPEPSRKGPRALGIDERPFLGMEFLLRDKHADLAEDEKADDHPLGEGREHVDDINDKEGLGHVSISAIVLRGRGREEDLPGWLKPNKNLHRVFHSVNGQVQYKQTRGFLTQCKLPSLKDKVVLIVDASNLTTAAHHGIWKGDRENIRDTDFGEAYKQAVKSAIEDSRKLKDLNHKVAQAWLGPEIEDQSKNILESFIADDPLFAHVLDDTDPTVPGGVGVEHIVEDFEGEVSPSFVRYQAGRLHRGETTIKVNLKGKHTPIFLTTDVENGYLNRSENKGVIRIPADVEAKFLWRAHLNNGNLTIVLIPKGGLLQEGQTFKFSASLKDEGMPHAVETNEVELQIVSEVSVPRPPPGPPKPRTGPSKGLPKFVWLAKKGELETDVNGEVEKWPEHWFKKSNGKEIGFLEGGFVRLLSEDESGKEKAIHYVNFDNSYHLSRRKKFKSPVERDIVTEKYKFAMRILMLAHENSVRKRVKGLDEESPWLQIDREELSEIAARGFASTVIGLTTSLPKIMENYNPQKGVEDGEGDDGV